MGFVEEEVAWWSRPPRIAIDPAANIVLNWNAHEGCLAAHSLPSSVFAAKPALLREVRAVAEDSYIVCDMDSPNGRGLLWVISSNGHDLRVSDGSRYGAQDRFLKLLGLRLNMMYGLPLEHWLDCMRLLLLPRV